MYQTERIYTKKLCQNSFFIIIKIYIYIYEEKKEATGEERENVPFQNLQGLISSTNAL